MFTTKMRDRKDGGADVVIEENGVPMIVMSLEQWMELSAVKWAQKLAREELESLGPYA